MNSIGIDLGTTNSVACTIKDGQFRYLQFRHKDLLPSTLLYKDGKITVGETAKKKAKIYPDNYIASAKTYMGNDEKKWNIEDRTFTPTDVAAEVLSEIYKAAKEFFGNDEKIQAVITTPAYFSSKQNGATAEAGKRAGFEVKQIIGEPVAAALAYASEGMKKAEKLYVIDLGGGTFDVTMLEVLSQNEYRTIMKDGDNHLGGDDFDQAIEEILESRIRQDIGVDLSSQEASGLKPEVYGRAKQKLLQESEKVKCMLSDAEAEQCSIVNLFPYRDGSYDLDTEITREEFMSEASKLVRHVKEIIRRSMEQGGYSVDDIDRVILVGGSANMPFVRQFVEEYFHKEPYADKDLSKLVAMGAAIKADADRGDTIILHDIVAHSLGIEVINDKFSIILPKGKEYPCENTENYTTTCDYQESVTIAVYEGEDTENIHNDEFFDKFLLQDIQKAPAGVPQIKVTFSFDESCILHVTAKDTHTGSANAKDIKIDWSKHK